MFRSTLQLEWLNRSTSKTGILGCQSMLNWLLFINLSFLRKHPLFLMQSSRNIYPKTKKWPNLRIWSPCLRPHVKNGEKVFEESEKP